MDQLQEQVTGQTETIAEDERVFDESARPAGTLELPPDISPEEAEQRIHEWVEARAGAEEPLDPSAIDQLSAEEAEQLAAQPLQMQVPMLEIPLHGVNIQSVPGQNDGEKLLLLGPIAITFVLPLSKVGVQHTVKELTGGIEIASAIPDGLKLVTP